MPSEFEAGVEEQRWQDPLTPHALTGVSCPQMVPWAEGEKGRSKGLCQGQLSGLSMPCALCPVCLVPQEVPTAHDLIGDIQQTWRATCFCG